MLCIYVRKKLMVLSSYIIYIHSVTSEWQEYNETSQPPSKQHLLLQD